MKILQYCGTWPAVLLSCEYQVQMLFEICQNITENVLRAEETEDSDNKYLQAYGRKKLNSGID